MIEVSIGAALLIYLGLLLLFIFGLWLFTHLKQKKKKGLPAYEQLAICEYCQTVYLANPLNSVTTCPTCKLLNKGNWY